MRTYRIDMVCGKASIRFWLDARSTLSAVVRGYWSSLRERKLLTRKGITSFSVTLEA